MGRSCEPGSKAQPLKISPSDKRDSELRRSSRVKKASRTMESQQWQIDHGLIPAPSARAKAMKVKNAPVKLYSDNFR